MDVGLILGDQLSLSLPTLRRLNPERDLIVMAEVMSEAAYVPHHRQKLHTVFSAMRHFAQELAQRGWRVHYVRLEEQVSEFEIALAQVFAPESPTTVVVTEPGEYRLMKRFADWQQSRPWNVEILEDHRFLVSLSDFYHWADGRNQLRMEHFYRWMRRRTGFLMDEHDQPEGGQWNYDADNRKAWRGDPVPPEPVRFTPDAIDRDIDRLMDERFSDQWGHYQAGLWPVTREQALSVLDHAMQHLAQFGDYQDAMAEDQPWLFHTRLSSSINLGLLTPQEVCEAAASEFYQGRAPLNAVEGFIRQIIGWREFVRGLYWFLHLYEPQNALDHHQPLPAYYWSADTRMNCMRQTVSQTRDLAYAHHIQRLMVTGNFALIAGINPESVSEWYLSVYIDAFQWVERPNTIAMALHADGGRMTSKPYAASGQYIHRMSDYCRQCWYRVKETTGSRACPFNGLYWHFLMRHRERFRDNGRMTLMYRNLDRKSDAEKAALWEQGEQLIARLPAL